MDIAMPRTSVRLRSFRRWVASAALAAAVAVPAAAFAQVVVIANGSPITAYDIEQRTKLIATSTHKAPTRQQVIQDLIDDRIKITKAKSYGFEVTDTEADLAPQLLELLGSIQVGKLTTPEATAQGLQMFALCDKKESKTDSPLKREVRQALYAKKFDVEAKKYLDEIRKSAMIEYK